MNTVTWTSGQDAAVALSPVIDGKERQRERLRAIIDEMKRAFIAEAFKGLRN